jgi:hypothetical protein
MVGEDHRNTLPMSAEAAYTRPWLVSLSMAALR